MVNWLNGLIYFSLVWLWVSIPALILIAILFGRLIKLQFKYWLLAKQGYHKVEHMGIDKVVRTFFLRPKDDHFEFENGIYFQQKDAYMKSSKEVIFPPEKDLTSKSDDTKLTAEEKELLKLFKQIGKLKYDSDSVFLQWGIPTIYYVGNDPNPLNPSDRKKVYDSKVMFAYIKRLLLEKEWKFVKRVLTLTIIGFGLALILGYLSWGNSSKFAETSASCLQMLNTSQHELVSCLNITGQNTTIFM
jgi:hypothetical protein